MRLETHGIAIRDLERHVGQLANLLSEGAPGILPATTERNPKEIINTVSLRSGQVLNDLNAKQKGKVIKIQVKIIEEQKNNKNQEDEVGVDLEDDLKEKTKTI